LSDPDCVFCRIVAGEIPCWRVLEDDHVLAFLDVGPLARGHTLIVPREHHATIDTLPDAIAAACGEAVARVSRAVRAATGAAGWNVLQNNGRVAGQEVEHVHFHVIPRESGDGLGYRWKPGKLTDDDANALRRELAERLGG